MSTNLQKLRKADLHVHLEGSVSYETLRALASKNGVSLGAPTNFGRHVISPPRGLASGPVSFSSFLDFIGVYVKISECIKNADDVAFVAREYAKSCKEQNIVYSEIYFSPSTFRELGRPLEDLFDGLIAAQQIAMRDYQTRFRWIFDIVRNNASDGFDTLDLALTARRRGVDVVALGLGGYEKDFPARPFANVFVAARAEGFITLAHAGETAGPESIRETIDLLRPTRIGHGITIVQDAELLRRCADSDVIFEVCPWSNILLGLGNRESHPLPQMFAAGIKVVLGADDPGIFQKTLTDNYVLANELGLDLNVLSKIAERSRSTH